jgi:hypothetical protein
MTPFPPDAERAELVATPALPDPDENLDEVLRLAQSIVKHAAETACGGLGMDASAIHLAEQAIALDAHLAAGGLPPKRWTGPATETRGDRVRSEIDRLEDHLRGCREEREAAEAVAEKLEQAIRQVLPALTKEFQHLAVERNFDGGPVEESWIVKALREALG